MERHWAESFSLHLDCAIVSFSKGLYIYTYHNVIRKPYFDNSVRQEMGK